MSEIIINRNTSSGREGFRSIMLAALLDEHAHEDAPDRERGSDEGGAIYAAYIIQGLQPEFDMKAGMLEVYRQTSAPGQRVL